MMQPRFTRHSTVLEYGTRPFYGEGRAWIETQQCKNSWIRRHPLFEEFQASNNEVLQTDKHMVVRVALWGHGVIVY